MRRSIFFTILGNVTAGRLLKKYKVENRNAHESSRLALNLITFEDHYESSEFYGTVHFRNIPRYHILIRF